MNLDRILEIARQYPERVTVLPVPRNLTRSARANRRHPEEGEISLRVPDGWVQNLKGDQDRRDLVFCVHIPRELADLGETRVILPNEAKGVPVRRKVAAR